MARVKCPNCGTERVVMDGKVKECRKCGRKLRAEDAITKKKKKAGSIKKDNLQNNKLGNQS